MFSPENAGPGRARQGARGRQGTPSFAGYGSQAFWEAYEPATFSNFRIFRA
jgi:hypothetical protein